MKPAYAVLYALMFSLCMAANADLQPITSGSDAQPLVDQANNVVSVTQLSLENHQYKIVSMGSNFDAALATIVLVGDKDGVGLDAGYLGAFQISPTDQLRNLKSARVGNGNVILTFYTMDGKLAWRAIRYDDANKSLKMTSP